jgi:hypothetical protein
MGPVWRGVFGERDGAFQGWGLGRNTKERCMKPIVAAAYTFALYFIGCAVVDYSQGHQFAQLVDWLFGVGLAYLAARYQNKGIK